MILVTKLIAKMQPDIHLGNGARICLQGRGQLGKGSLFLLYEELLLAKGAGKIHDLQQITSRWGLHGAAAVPAWLQIIKEL